MSFWTRLQPCEAPSRRDHLAHFLPRNAAKLNKSTKALPAWTGKPWGDVLGTAQFAAERRLGCRSTPISSLRACYARRRTGILLFPTGTLPSRLSLQHRPLVEFPGEQQFHVDFVPAANWSLPQSVPRRLPRTRSRKPRLNPLSGKRSATSSNACCCHDHLASGLSGQTGAVEVAETLEIYRPSC